ncbi:MAG TPA: PIN domain-containing protein [Acidobacteriaceae bacterium]|nr:PIN domain-containing protein [Acidobacteriaceae bacterium]
MHDLLRVFLDANVLFSAALKPESRLQGFWKMRNLVPLTSMYAAGEARRNCIDEDHAMRLTVLLEQTHFASDVPSVLLPAHIRLPAKDAPILAPAIQAGADYLITGDRHHFRRWMNLPIPTVIGLLVIQQPAQFLDEHLDRPEK